MALIDFVNVRIYSIECLRKIKIKNSLNVKTYLMKIYVSITTNVALLITQRSNDQAYRDLITKKDALMISVNDLLKPD